jgi:hypothetical protein
MYQYGNGKKIKIILYFWLCTGTYNKNMVIGRICFQNLANLGHFLMKIPSYRSKSYSSGKLFGEILPINFFGLRHLWWKWFHHIE